MNRILRTVAASLLVLGLVVGASLPASAFAKSENSGKGNAKVRVEAGATTSTSSVKAKDDNKGKSEDRGFLWRIRELLTFGAGKSGKTPKGLLRAPGIQKKIGRIGTTTVAVSPIISNIQVNRVASTSVRISWETNKATMGKLYFSTSRPVGTTSPVVANASRSGTLHTVTLKNLNASTTYFYKVEARDYSGKVTTSTELSFATTGGTVADTMAPVISGIAATTTATGVNVSWTTNEPASSKVWYGTSTPVIGATSTQTVMTSALVTAHTVALPVLAASTTYYFMVSSADAAGNTSSSAELNFQVLP
jgi:hypothetical protein